MATRSRAGRRGGGLAQSGANHVNPQPARNGRRVANAGLTASGGRRGGGPLPAGDGVIAASVSGQRATARERVALDDARSRLG